MNDDVIGALLPLRLKAHAQVQHGDLAHAEQLFWQILEMAPDDVEALEFLATECLGREENDQAITLLSRAHQRQPHSAAILHRLGFAQMTDGDFAGAVVSLKQCVSTAPHMFVARLRLGIALEQQGHRHDALINYLGAINDAQSRGHWLSDATTALGFRDAVKHAMKYVAQHRRQYFDEVLEPLRQRYGLSELVRVEACLAIYLGERSASIPDARQRPKFLYFPGVPSLPYYPRQRFPWMGELEENTAAIRAELRDVLAQASSLESFLQTDSPENTAELLRSAGSQDPAWDAYFFYRHGERHAEHSANCPRTSALLDALPLARVREHSPEALFSVLRPGTHILPHRGVTNTRLVTHLPLIVPPDCALRVGGDIHTWEEGHCVTFDDTFEHEAWNNSGETRVVLILDIWNPDLSEAERAAVSDLVGAIGDFNRACEIPSPTG